MDILFLSFPLDFQVAEITHVHSKANLVRFFYLSEALTDSNVFLCYLFDKKMDS